MGDHDRAKIDANPSCGLERPEQVPFAATPFHHPAIFAYKPAMVCDQLMVKVGLDTTRPGIILGDFIEKCRARDLRH